MKSINEIKEGSRFGLLVIVREIDPVLSYRPNNVIAKRRQWLCKCDCGNDFRVPGTNLLTKKTKPGTRSCGCLRPAAREPGGAAMHVKYMTYKKEAEKRGLPFEITEEEFSIVTGFNCRYCECPPSKSFAVKSCIGQFIWNGIDRIDSAKGYIHGNMAPCCWRCNSMKANHSYEALIDHCYKIIRVKEKHSATRG